MPSDSNRKGPQNKHEQELVDTLGNPLATEDEWLHANDKLGDYKSKATKSDQNEKRTRHFAEVAILAAMGLGVVGLINFSQPSNFHQAAPVPTVAPAATNLPAAPAKTDVDFGPYMASLQRNIKRNWYPPKHNEYKRVVVLFSISKDGHLSKLKLEKSSGSAKADKAALQAVGDAESKFGTLPEGAPDSVDIQFTFDYNVFHNTKATDTADDK